MRKIIFIAFWAMLMIMPAVGQVTFGVRAGGAYSSLVQKVEGHTMQVPVSVSAWPDLPIYIYIRACLCVPNWRL